ncbi:MAG TPA: redoxin domain-containing protein [Candidatus Angelobacter sp.]|nr:redoxin domain-containing protein [Candidatus Angelobacter sp.]
MTPLQVGDEAPDFDVPAVIGNIKQQVKLSDYRGKQNVVLVFYPADWTPVCSAELPAFNAELEKFQGYNAAVIGMSVDSIPSHIAWQKKEIGVLSLPLASDFYPHGAVATKYGILREGEPVAGISERAVFVVDKKGKIAYAKVHPIDRQPDTEEVFAVLRKL